MTTKISFYPKKKYLGPELEDGQKISYVYNGLSWHTFRTDCTASFIGVQDGDAGYAYRYQYVAAAAMVLTGLGVGAYLAKRGKNKFRTSTAPEEDEYYDNGNSHFSWMEYPGNGGAESIPSGDGTLRSLPLTRSQKVLLKALEGGGGNGDPRTLPDFVQMDGEAADIEIALHSKRKSFIPRFLRRNR